MKTSDDLRHGRAVKLMVGASAGGHANELQILLEAARGLWPFEPAGYVTTMEITAQGFIKYGKPVHVIGESDRRKPLQAVAVLWRTLRLALRERPDAVVTTGSMPLAIFCLWSKLLGARIVWIDSVAQIEHLSLSGRLMRRVADLCLAQWPDVAARYPNVEYAGEVL
jgi:UDP-N-acetylglucosamine:LPS N-acetylglucosamine transferase